MGAMVTVPGRITLYGVGGALTVALTLLVATAGSGLAWVALVAMPLVTGLVVRRRYLCGGVSPLLIVACALVATAVLGALFGRSVGANGGVSVTLSLDDTDTWRTAVLLCWSATVLLVGGGAALAVLRRRPLAAVAAHVTVPPSAARTRLEAWGRGVDRTVRRAGEALQGPEPRARGLLLAASALPLVALVLVDGTALLERNDYLIGASGSIDGSIAKVGLVGVIGCGLVAGLDRGATRVAALVAASGYLVVFFAMGSRSLAMVPVLVAIGVHVARPRRASAFLLAGSVVLALLLLPIPLYLRGIGTHGLVPYLAALPDLLGQEDVFSGAADNLLISFPLVGTTAFGVPHLPLHLFWMQVDPRPGSTVGWYDVDQALRLNLDTPYAGAGELANYGWGVLTGFWLVAGMLLGAVQREIADLTALGRRGVALALTALPLVFAILILQYNLRSAVRLLVYTAVLALAARALRALRDLGTRLPAPTP
jgi:hypothetical protein